MEVNKELLESLLTEASSFAGGKYLGQSYAQLIEMGSYEEPGLKLVPEDVELTQLYAGLAVYSSDLHTYLSQSPHAEAAWFEEVIAAVHSKEQERYGSGAFPYDDPAFPYGFELQAFPKGLAQAADKGHPTVTPLGDLAIRHEWTVKPGKKLFIEFGVKFKEVICGKDGPYEQFEKHALTQEALPAVIATAIIAVLAATTLWYPLIVYVALLIIKTGLKVYCEPPKPSVT